MKRTRAEKSDAPGRSSHTHKVQDSRLRAYFYAAKEVGMSEWPSGQLRFDNTIHVVKDPEGADIFACPGPLSLFQDPNKLDLFPHMKDAEQRHVFFDVADRTTMFNGKSCVFIRCNLTTELLQSDPNSISWPWPVEDFSECIEPPEGGFKYDVSFQGWVGSPTRYQSVNACLQNPAITRDIQTYPDFTGYIYETPEGIRRRKEFRRSMKESRLALCPESGKGILPYRFYEAMSAGRVPVCVSSDHVFPFEDEIPYDEFVLKIPRDKAHVTGQCIREFLDQHSDDDIIAKGAKARSWWVQRLNREDWPQTMAYAVRKKFKQLGLYSGTV